MALTISTHPSEVITNAPEFTVDTSLTEGASYQNLRVRATIHIGGESAAQAVLEQPDGINDWDIYDILKSLTGRCDEAVGGSTQHIQPGIGSELLTSWTQYSADFITFTTSGRAISSAITSSPNPDYAQSNDLGSAAIGDLYVVGIEEDYTDTGANSCKLKFSTGTPYADAHYNRYAGLASAKLIPSHIYFFRAREVDTSPHIFLGNDTAGTNCAVTATVHKISDFKNNPGVYFEVKFEEVYENVSDVTTIGAESWSDTLLFIPAGVRPGESFDTDYMINGASHNFLSRADDSLYKFGVNDEKRIMYAMIADYVNSKVTTDAGADTSATVANVGWGMIILNDNIALVDADDATIAVEIRAVESDDTLDYIGASLTVGAELRCFSDIRCLSFVGELGEETILFRGLHSKDQRADKSYYKDVNRVRRVLRAYKYFREKLRALVETGSTRQLMAELIYTEEEVWMLDSDETAGYKEVTVVDDDYQITDKNSIFESEIDIDYHE